MSHPKRIEELLDLFVNGHISDDERNELFNRINADAEDEHVTAWFYKMWDETPLAKQDEKTVKAFNEIRSKLNFNEKALGNFMLKPKGKLVYTFIKYAAVFILAFLIAGMVFMKSNLPVRFSENAVNEISIPYGSKGNIVLPDGSKIWLNSGSRLTYSDFTRSDTRDVFLEGEAFFDVRSNAKKPFIVNTSSIKVKVLGTKFNVKSYPAEKVTETTLVSGKVEIQDKNSPGLITLEPNQKATFITRFRPVKKQNIITGTTEKVTKEQTSKIIENVDTESTVAWKDEKLVFNNERFESLIVKLERWYDVKISIKDTAINNFRYTGTFEKENIEQALGALKIASPLDFTIQKNNVEIFASK